MFERFTEAFRVLYCWFLIGLAMLIFAVLVEIAIQLQDNSVQKAGHHRQGYRRNKWSIRRLAWRFAWKGKRFLKRYGPMIATIGTIVVPTLQIVVETLKIVGAY